MPNNEWAGCCCCCCTPKGLAAGAVPKRPVEGLEEAEGLANPAKDVVVAGAAAHNQTP